MSNEVNNFLFGFISEAVKPLLHRLPLGCGLKADELPQPCFRISHKISQNCDTSIKIYLDYTSILMYDVDRYENKRPTSTSTQGTLAFCFCVGLTTAWRSLLTEIPAEGSIPSSSTTH